MLTVSHLTKYYGKNPACADISFSLDPGTITVLLGPNGAGKSTLLKSVVGFLRFSGEVSVGGFPNRSAEAKRLFGYMPEIPALYPNLTVMEHLEFLARAYRLQNWRPLADSLLDRFELTDKKKKFGDELSKGMQQKLNLCLGLLTRPRLVLMDEPMIGLDPHAIKELKSVMEEIRATGGTVLVSTHMIDSVDMLWDRTLIMQKGQLRADVTKEQLSADGLTLEKLFFAITEQETPMQTNSEATPCE